jgi:hypothetical protein
MYQRHIRFPQSLQSDLLGQLDTVLFERQRDQAAMDATRVRSGNHPADRQSAERAHQVS